MVSKKSEILRRFFRTITIDDRLPYPSLHFLGLAAQHRRLIGHADRFQMHIGIEAGGVRTAEFVEKLLLVAAVPDVIADVIGIGEGKHDQVMAFAVSQARGNWSPWFLRVRPCRE